MWVLELSCQPMKLALTIFLEYSASWAMLQECIFCPFMSQVKGAGDRNMYHRSTTQPSCCENRRVQSVPPSLLSAFPCLSVLTWSCTQSRLSWDCVEASLSPGWEWRWDVSCRVLEMVFEAFLCSVWRPFTLFSGGLFSQAPGNQFLPGISNTSASCGHPGGEGTGLLLAKLLASRILWRFLFSFLSSACLTGTVENIEEKGLLSLFYLTTVCVTAVLQKGACSSALWRRNNTDYMCNSTFSSSQVKRSKIKKKLIFIIWTQYT